MLLRKMFMFTAFSFLLLFASISMVTAQGAKVEILTGENLKKVVPTSFYFAGQSASTQIRNSAAAKFGENHYLVVGMVDTSGYSTEISGKYEGFFITDAPVKIGDKELGTGAYGFGFSKEGNIKIFDLSSKEILSVSTTNDAAMKRPRPLMMSNDGNAIRLYKGKDYVLISAK